MRKLAWLHAMLNYYEREVVTTSCTGNLTLQVTWNLELIVELEAFSSYQDRAKPYFVFHLLQESIDTFRLLLEVGRET